MSRLLIDSVLIFNKDASAPLRNQTGLIVKKDEWEEIKQAVDNFYNHYSTEDISNANQRFEEKHQKELSKHRSCESKKKKQGYVYFVMADGEKIKVGQTTNIDSRFKSLQTASPNQLEMIGYIPCEDCVDLEEEIHDYFLNQRTIGEWFDITQKDIVDFCTEKGCDFFEYR